MGPKNIRTDGLDDDGKDGTDWIEALGFGEDYDDDPIKIIDEEEI